MKVPLLLREIETRTEDFHEKEIVLKILDKEEASLSMWPLLAFTERTYLLKVRINYINNTVIQLLN